MNIFSIAWNLRERGISEKVADAVSAICIRDSRTLGYEDAITVLVDAGIASEAAKKLFDPINVPTNIPEWEEMEIVYVTMDERREAFIKAAFAELKI